MTRFSHAFSCACCTGFRSFWQGTCLLMDITSIIMCLGVAWIGMKNVWKVYTLLVKIQEVGSRSQAQLEERHAMGWWLIDLWWCNVMSNSRNVAHDESDNFNSIQMAYCASLFTYSVGMCFHCSCSCRQCTFPPKEFSYKIFKATDHSFLKVFFVAHFILTTVSYGVPSPFRSTDIDYLFNLSYYSRILADNTSVCLSHHTAGGLWTCLWRWQVFCSRLIALVLLLLSFAAVRSQGYEMCFKCGSAQH